MGLAPFGKPLYVNLIKENLVDIKEDGSFRINQDFLTIQLFKMTNEKFDKLFEILLENLNQKLISFT